MEAHMLRCLGAVHQLCGKCGPSLESITFGVKNEGRMPCLWKCSIAFLCRWLYVHDTWQFQAWLIKSLCHYLWLLESTIWGPHPKKRRKITSTRASIKFMVFSSAGHNSFAFAAIESPCDDKWLDGRSSVNTAWLQFYILTFNCPQ